MTDVVVPAHNEAATIGQVVDAARAAPSVSSVIVVADKCTDATAAIAQQHGADMVVEIAAGNKGSAMAAGLAHVTTADVLFVDGDLVGLQWQHIEGLLLAGPIGGQVSGLRDEKYALGSNRLPPITGERRLPTKLARTVQLDGAGYRAETLINAAVGRARLPHKNYVMVGVHNPTRASRAPVSWVTMWGDLALLAVVNLPGLIAYAMHPDG